MGPFMEFRNIDENSIEKYKKELLEKYLKFNSLNKNIYREYQNLSPIYKDMEQKNIKILWEGVDPKFIVWFDHRIYGTFIKSFIPLFSLKDYKSINYEKMVLAIKNHITFKKDKNLYEYITEDNLYNNYVLDRLGFKKVAALTKMAINPENLKEVYDEKKSFSFFRSKETKLEKATMDTLAKRVKIQNQIFKAKDRFPLSRSDVFLDMKSKTYINDLSFFYIRNNKAIGYCQIVLYNEGYFLINFGIVPSYRSIGYGRDFLYKVVLKAKEYGIKNLMLTVNKDNKKAKKLYSDFGFEIIREETTWHFKSNHKKI